MKIAFINGFARSGKTTLLTAMAAMAGVQVVSTSQELDKFVDKLVAEFNLDQPVNHEDRRALKIKTAERLIVPTLGRVALVGAAINKIAKVSELVLIETIGGEEYFMMLRALNTHLPRADSMNINIRRDGEKGGIDIRKLLPSAIDVWNVSPTEAAWAIDGPEAVRELLHA